MIGVVDREHGGCGGKMDEGKFTSKKGTVNCVEIDLNELAVGTFLMVFGY